MSTTQNFFGCIESMPCAPTVELLSQLLEEALQRIGCLVLEKPDITGLDKLARTIRRDHTFVGSMSSLVQRQQHLYIPASAEQPLPIQPALCDPARQGSPHQNPHAVLSGLHHTCCASNPPVEFSPHMPTCSPTACPPHAANQTPQAQPHEQTLIPCQNQQPLVPASQAQLQGILNNLRGFVGELLAATTAPGVIAVRHRFARSPTPNQPNQNGHTITTHLTLNCTPSCTDAGSISGSTSTSAVAAAHVQLNSATPSSFPGPPYSCADSHSSGTRPFQDQVLSCSGQPTLPVVPASKATGKGARSVEVDVVANDGCTWIEVKNQESFGLGSSHFAGMTNICTCSAYVTVVKHACITGSSRFLNLNLQPWPSPSMP